MCVCVYNEEVWFCLISPEFGKADQNWERDSGNAYLQTSFYFAVGSRCLQGLSEDE